MKRVLAGSSSTLEADLSASALFSRRKPMEWVKTVDVSSVFHNDDMDFDDKVDAIVDIFRKEFPSDISDLYWELADILECLESATDVDDFDSIWNEMYDWADENHIWIKTR
jgi:hypothetical protein